MKVVLISGKLQNGKNQVADFLKEFAQEDNYKIGNKSFANKLKNNCKQDFIMLVEYLNEYVEDFISNFGDCLTVEAMQKLKQLKIRDDNWYEDKTDVTRIILQIVGTEIFRQRVDNDYWIKQISDEEIKDDFVFITDGRFLNEIELYSSLIKEKNKNVEVYKIRVNRKDLKTDNIYNEHLSEKELDNYTGWDFVINNNGTLEDLKNNVKEVYNKIKE
jgi:dephospho-CoA kinase